MLKLGRDWPWKTVSSHLKSTNFEFSPRQCQVVKLCICAKFLDTKLSQKSNFVNSEGVSTNTQVATGCPTRDICNYGNYIPCFNSEVAKNYVARLLLLSKHFVGSLRATCAREHFKLRAHVLSSYEYIVNFVRKAPFDTSQWLAGLPCLNKVDLTWLACAL